MSKNGRLPTCQPFKNPTKTSQPHPPTPSFSKKKQVAQAPALPPILAYGCLGPNGVSTKLLPTRGGPSMMPDLHFVSDICGQ